MSEVEEGSAPAVADNNVADLEQSYQSPFTLHNTEKTYGLREQNVITVIASKRLYKAELAILLKLHHGLEVKKVRSLTTPEKKRVLRKEVVKRKVFHKYYVTLSQGQSLPDAD